jgi:hypothetical protein
MDFRIVLCREDDNHLMAQSRRSPWLEFVNATLWMEHSAPHTSPPSIPSLQTITALHAPSMLQGYKATKLSSQHS